MKRMTALLLAGLMLLCPWIAAGAEREDMAVTEEIWLDGALGKLYGMLTAPAGDGPVPLVILSHGFGGNLMGNQPYADHFAAQGFAVFNFDFCGGGYGSRSDGTTRDMSVLTEAEDLNAVLDHFLVEGRFAPIFLWGSSQGGFVSSYVAAQRPQDVQAMVLEFPAFVLQDDARARVAEDGSFPETERVMTVPIGRVYSEDAVSFDIYDVIGAYTGDVLILHGDRDAIVPLSYSQRAAEVYAHAELIVMPGQNHGFLGAARQEAQEKEAAFFAAHCEGIE